MFLFLLITFFQVLFSCTFLFFLHCISLHSSSRFPSHQFPLFYPLLLYLILITLPLLFNFIFHSPIFFFSCLLLLFDIAFFISSPPFSSHSFFLSYFPLPPQLSFPFDFSIIFLFALFSFFIFSSFLLLSNASIKVYGLAECSIWNIDFISFRLTTSLSLSHRFGTGWAISSPSENIGLLFLRIPRKHQ